jgi:hypothetical protein
MHYYPDSRWQSANRHSEVSRAMNLEDIERHAQQLAGDVLGLEIIEDAVLTKVPSEDPAEVALILNAAQNDSSVPRSDGEHPYLKQQDRKPPG